MATSAFWRHILARWQSVDGIVHLTYRHVQVATIPYLKSFQSYIASDSKFDAESYATAPARRDQVRKRLYIDTVWLNLPSLYCVYFMKDDDVELYPEHTCPEAVAAADKVDNVTLRHFIETFHQKSDLPVAMADNGKRRKNKQYIFSQLFSNDNPSLMRVAAPVYDWAMSNTGIESVFEASPDWHAPLLDANK